MTPDGELLRRYAETGDEAAFAELVRRHLPLVYGAALRQLNHDAHLAQDVAQGVFTDLARKAGELRHHPTLAGWLHTSARFQAGKMVRTEQRRRAREREAAAMNDDFATPEIPSEDLRPLLDEAIARLADDDRDAVLLRYYENKSFAEVGEILGLEPSAAHKRVARAVDKLREHFARAGITASAALLSTTLGTQAATTVPDGLAATVAGAAMAGTGVKTAATVVTAAKGAASLKGTSLVGLAMTAFWPATAIFATLRLAIFSGQPDPAEAQIPDRAKPSSARMLLELALVAAMLGTGVHYFPEHPGLVLACIAGFFAVHFALMAWHQPAQAKKWFRPKSWNGKIIWRFILGTAIEFSEIGVIGFATLRYPAATVLALRAAGGALFVALMLLGMKALKCWNGWRWALRITGRATYWAMIFMVKDYWSAHPVEFLGAALLLYLAFAAARLAADKWEAQTSPDPEKWRAWEEKAAEQREEARQRHAALAAIAPEFKALMRSQWAMTKIPRVVVLSAFLALGAALIAAGNSSPQADPALLTMVAYALVGVMAAGGVLTYFSWKKWRELHREKIRLVRAANEWMEVAEPLPLIANVVMLLLILKLFFDRDATSLPILAAVVMAGAGCGLLAKGRGRLGR